MTTKPTTFEEDMHTLQTLVQQLEQGDVSLEESLASYEKGMGLIEKCREQLAETETKVEKISAAYAKSKEPAE